MTCTANLPAPRNAASIEQLDAALPQTQCTRCGYPDCRAYAQAIASGEATINRCPPGGAEGIQRLARLTGQPLQALDAECGSEAPRDVALIDEAWCIGCTLCLDACPVDAILGAHKHMHSVITEACNGCALCLPACPVDCISLLPASGGATGWAAWSAAQAEQSRARYQFHQFRVQRGQHEHDTRLAAKAATKLADLAAHSQHTDPVVLDRKRAVIEAAMARARARADGAAPVPAIAPDPNTPTELSP